MATTSDYSCESKRRNCSSSRRGVAMAMAMVSAIALSPLYVERRRTSSSAEGSHLLHDQIIRWNSGFVLPVVLAGLILAIKTTSSSSSSESSPPSSSWVLRIGSSSWGLAGVLAMLLLVLSWQDSVQHFFWR